MNTQSPIELLPAHERRIVMQAIKAIEAKKGKEYAPTAAEIQVEIDKIINK